MTQDDFNATEWGAGMSVIYHGEEYPVDAVDFTERLIGIVGYVLYCDETTWVRCESVEVVK